MPTFFDIYRAELLASVIARPADYALRIDDTPESYATRTSDKMIANMRADRGVDRCHTETPTFRRTCKALGIGYNRKSMTARIQADLIAERGEDR